MKFRILFTTVALGVSSGSLTLASDCSTNFDSLRPGKSPRGWMSGFYGTTGTPVWTITRENSAPTKPMVLKRSGQAPYNWFVNSAANFVDGSVSAQFQIQAGKDDPEAGILWRQMDGQNYTYVRANAAKDNVVLYRMQEGKKVAIMEAEAKISFGVWHSLKADFQSEKVSISLDGKLLFTAKDIGTAKPGKVGLFSTADTIALFDDVECRKN